MSPTVRAALGAGVALGAVAAARLFPRSIDIGPSTADALEAWERGDDITSAQHAALAAHWVEVAEHLPGRTRAGARDVPQPVRRRGPMSTLTVMEPVDLAALCERAEAEGWSFGYVDLDAEREQLERDHPLVLGDAA